jgi:hypothetical protein
VITWCLVSLNYNPPMVVLFVLSCISGMTGSQQAYTAGLSYWLRCSLRTLSLSCSQTVTLLIFPSQVVRIRSLYYCAQKLFNNFCLCLICNHFKQLLWWTHLLFHLILVLLNNLDICPNYLTICLQLFYNFASLLCIFLTTNDLWTYYWPPNPQEYPASLPQYLRTFVS